ncbi:MAG: transposase [Candidatus Fermentibacterota bacterium]
MSKSGNRYPSELKFQVVLELLEGESIGRLARAYGVHPSSIRRWRRTFMKNGPSVFEARRSTADYESRISELQRLLRRKEVVAALLRNFLDRR